MFEQFTSASIKVEETDLLDLWYQDAGGPLGILAQWALNVRGRSIRGGHFFPEQNPDATIAALREFMLDGSKLPL